VGVGEVGAHRFTFLRTPPTAEEVEAKTTRLANAIRVLHRPEVIAVEKVAESLDVTDVRQLGKEATTPVTGCNDNPADDPQLFEWCWATSTPSRTRPRWKA
jgi:hypothetical protein